MHLFTISKDLLRGEKGIARKLMGGLQQQSKIHHQMEIEFSVLKS